MVRLKTRYLLFEILSPENLSLLKSEGQLQNAVDLRPALSEEINGRLLNKIIRDSIQLHFGDKGSGAVASTIAVKYFSPITCTGIIRVARDHYRMVWASLTYIGQVLDTKVIFRVVRVSGTIKRCEQACIARNKLFINAGNNGIALERFENDVEALE